LLRSAGVHVVQTPVRAPNCNAHAERFVRSIKHECLDRLIPLGERHLRRSIAEYLVYLPTSRSAQKLAPPEHAAERCRHATVRRETRCGLDVSAASTTAELGDH
jgi:hypothetical protein